MTSPSKRRFSSFAIAGLAALLVAATANIAQARSNRDAGHAEFSASRPAGTPILAVVSLRDQHVTIYDAEGKILQAPVSTGQTGYETPAGIYSVIQKEAEHYSNLYDDASMPFMQRITWSGIALHAGVLPGRPASHGCIRMPHEFAERLFEVTRLGLRVIIVRDDMSPVEISHPALFKPGPIRSEVASAAQPAEQPSEISPSRQMRLGASPPAGEAQPPRTWRAVAAAKRAEVEKATETAEEARRAAVKAHAEAARFMRPMRVAEVAKRRAEIQLADIERELADKTAPALEEKKAAASARLKEAQTQLDALKGEGQEKLDAAATAREAARAAEAARNAAVTAAKIAENKMAPVSVFISRQTQTLYVRQGFRPIFDTPVTIRDPETPIGTTLFTALSYTDDGADVRWSALAMYASAAGPEVAVAGKQPQRKSVPRQAEPTATDVAAAKVALERVTIPQEAAERIAEFVSPGSALIISDEPLSKETSKGTDFVVLMSGEPQGGIKIRRRSPYMGYGSDRPYRRSPYGYGGNPFSWW